MGLLFEWWLADTAVLLTTLLVLIYLWCTATFGYWRSRGVRSVSNPAPFFGSMGPAFSQSKTFFKLIEDMYDELKGERYGGYFKLRKPAILLRDPELIKHVLSKDFQYFHDNDFHVNEKTDPMTAYNIFAMKGPKWKYARSKLTPIFTSGKIRVMFPLISDVCQQLKGNLQTRVDSEEPEFDAKELAGHFTTDVVASCAFGVKCDSLKDGDNEFRLMGRAIMTPSKFRAILLAVIFLFPGLSNVLALLGFKFIPEHVTDFFRRLVRDTMAYREQRGVQRPDLIQLLMQLKRMGSLEEDENKPSAIEQEAALDSGKFEMNDDFLTAQAIGFFVDGYETSSLALSMALHELAVNPEVQDRLRQELRAATAGGEVSYDVIRDCAYLDQVIMETLRLHSLVAMITRTCTQRYQLPGSELRLEVDTPVTIPLSALHQDPKYWPKPELFDPERFSKENKQHRVPFTHFAFGEGPRQCIGMRFAQTQVKAALATVILNFEVQPSAQTKRTIESDPNFFLLSPLGGVPLKVAPLTT